MVDVNQWIPSVEYDAVDAPYATAINSPPPEVIEYQSELPGKVVAVQVVPFVEYAAAVEFCEIATKMLSP
jgi:hypothetical protein